MFLLLIALARSADVTLVLPDGQDLAAWVGPATLAGFSVGPSGGGAEVELVQTPSGWAIVARDGEGAAKQVAIAPPNTPQAREDAIWLGSSLLSSLPGVPGRPSSAPPPPASASGAAKPTPSTPPPNTTKTPLVIASTEHTPPVPKRSRTPRLPSPAPEPVTPEAPAAPAATSPAPTPPASAEPPTPEPSPSAATEAPRTSTEAPPAATEAPPAATEAPPASTEAPPAPPPPEPPPSVSLPSPPLSPEQPTADPPPVRAPPWRPRPWASLGPAIDARADTSLTGGVTLSGGVRLGRSGWIGLGVRWLAPRTIPAIRASAVDASVDASIGAWWSPEGRFAPVAGLTVGASTRGYQQGAREVGAFVVAVGSVEVGARARLGDHLDAVVLARGSADASTTFVEFGERDPVALSPWAFGATVSLRGALP